MDGNKVVLPYDSEAERMLARVTLMRFGVPERVLDRSVPVGADE